MAGQTSKNPLLGKLAGRLGSIMDANKGKPPEIGNAKLPGGIEGGIARVTEVKIGEYKEGDFKGEKFFYMSAVVVEPKQFKGQTVAGMTTKIGPEALCDTLLKEGKRKTLNDHFAYMRNHLLILGLNIDGYTGTDEERYAKLLAGMEALKKSGPNGGGPYTRFRTSKLPAQNIAQRSDGKWVLEQDGKIVEGKSWPTKEAAITANKFAGTPEVPKEPKVYEEWNGVVDGYKENIDPTAGVEEGIYQPAGPSGQNTAPKTNGQPPSKKPPVQTAVKAPDPEPEPEQATFDEFGDLESLRAAAEGGDENAREKLLEYADQKGLRAEAENSEDETWAEVVAMIDGSYAPASETPEAGYDEPPVDSPAAWEPQVEEMYFYHPPSHYDPKSKAPNLRLKLGKNKKPVEAAQCEVLAVDTDNQTADLKDIDTKTAYKNVPWDAFRPTE